MADLKGYIRINYTLVNSESSLLRIRLFLDEFSLSKNEGREIKISGDGSFTINNFDPGSNYIFFERSPDSQYALFGTNTRELTIPFPSNSDVTRGYNQPLKVIPFPTPDSKGDYVFDLESFSYQLDETNIESTKLNIFKLALFSDLIEPAPGSLNIENELGGLDIQVLDSRLNQIDYLLYDNYSKNEEYYRKDDLYKPYNYKIILGNKGTDEPTGLIIFESNIITIIYDKNEKFKISDPNAPPKIPFLFRFSPKKENTPYLPFYIEPSNGDSFSYSSRINEKNEIIQQVPKIEIVNDEAFSYYVPNNYVFEEEEVPSAETEKFKVDFPYEVQEYEFDIPSRFRVQLGTIIRQLIRRIKDFVTNAITRIILEKLGVKPQVLTFLIKRDFSNPATLQLIRSLGIPLAIDPQILQDFFKGKIKLKDLPPSERKRILLMLLPLLPPICPPQPILRQIIITRNNILSALETINSYIQSISFTIVAISAGLRLTKRTILTIRVIKKTILLTAKALSKVTPPIRLPAPLQSTLNDLTELADKLRFAPTGTPRLDKLEELIKSVEPPLTLASSVIGQAVILLNFLDFLLIKCSLENGIEENGIEENITPISEELIQAANRQQVASETLNGALYNGFIIKIEEVPFSPTVIRRKAVGINQSGIKLIETPLSFTTNPQFLIDELKFIIDRDDLKAY